MNAIGAASRRAASRAKASKKLAGRPCKSPSGAAGRCVPAAPVRFFGLARSVPVMLDVNPAVRPVLRSEEHTSELQSLMRISYAVLCLKKKKNKGTAKHNAGSRAEAYTKNKNKTQC